MILVVEGRVVRSGIGIGDRGWIMIKIIQCSFS